MYTSVRRISTNLKKSYLSELHERVLKNANTGYNEVKGTVIQMMARRLSAKDRKLLFTNDGDLNFEVKNNNVPTTVLKQDVLSTKVDSNINHAPLFEVNNSSKDSILFHPILGERIADLGYKKLFLTNIRSLAHAPVWNKQRILRPDRVQVIARDKVHNKLEKSISGTISFYMDQETKEFGIIDGQHRVGSLIILAQKGHWNPVDRNVLVEVFPTNSEAEVSALFREINAAESVRLVDLALHEDDGARCTVEPELAQESDIEAVLLQPITKLEEKQDKANDQVLQQDHAGLVQLLDAATDALATRHPGMFKPSSRCKPPHLNIDVLRDDLFQSGFVSRRGLLTAEALLRALDEVNAALRSKYAADAARTLGKTTQTAVRKAVEHDLFLGLDKAWMYI